MDVYKCISGICVGKHIPREACAHNCDTASKTHVCMQLHQAYRTLQLCQKCKISCSYYT